MAIQSINPATGKVLDTFEEWTAEKTAHVVSQVHKAWLEWRNSSFAERAAVMKGAAEVLRHNRDEFAQLMALEMGKPIRQGRDEVEKCAWGCEYFAENAEAMLAPESANSDGSAAYVAFRPLGVVLAIMPWNFPFWQVFRFAAPALMAGNTAVLKHSSNVPLTALAIEQVFVRAGFPEDVFRTLLVSSSHAEEVLENPLVRAVSLTGSSDAGRHVARRAGELLKKSVLELGGSDPFVVLDDADLDSAARIAAKARCFNSGQSCIAAKRFIVERSVYGPFLNRFRTAMASLVVGDPMEERTEVGPLARGDLREALHEQVLDAVQHGAELALGGMIPHKDGFFYPTTVLSGVRPGMRAYHEELFGPVASVIPVRDDEEAIEVANDTPFGLGGSVWTRDTAKGEALAARIEAGAVFVNGMVKSDPRLPFGGIKDSGFGRELSRYGIREFTNVQTVWIK
ncbi:NAD-dependent succinate-semialdehyde dehydrogenase [Geomonas sp. RF6]|uniref:NAD-dependent succinate-semialdehyde dehydrogenase n=1 Tax=Geomonas sp. RF6 TaxID=2897342 RepID=UPI001E430990|nr:NAD-dependent succinate-semialdehyde dehydrogenase [Geomonas sp. RF6]UFS69394.1 NAD-dependent succinate-semialdehyde dehydrogenase [Geomonas sp. RF6]